MEMTAITDKPVPSVNSIHPAPAILKKSMKYFVLYKETHCVRMKKNESDRKNAIMEKEKEIL
jgi:hypothetical protein